MLSPNIVDRLYYICYHLNLSLAICLEKHGHFYFVVTLANSDGLK